jgi:hypothetical protein
VGEDSEILTPRQQNGRGRGHMDSGIRLEEILRSISGEIDMPIDREGSHFVLHYDALYECTVALASSGSAVELSSPLCILGANAERILECALILTLHGVKNFGATISLCAAAPVLQLGMRHPMGGLDRETMADVLARFIVSARWVRNELMNAGAVQQTPPASEHSDSMTMVWA